MKNFGRARGVAMTLGAVGLLALYACAVNDENPAPAPAGSGTDAGSGVTSQTGTSGSPAAANLCANHGGYDGMKALADAIIDASVADCRIGPMFTEALGAGDQTKHVRECFQIFLGARADCPGVGYVQGTTGDSAGEGCDSELPGVSFSVLDWAAFADFNASTPSIVPAALVAKGFSADDVRSMATVFEGAKKDLITDEVDANRYTQCAPNCSTGGAGCGGTTPTDAGADASNGTGDGGDGG